MSISKKPLLALTLSCIIVCYTSAQIIPSNTDESKVPKYTLPDVLQTTNGNKVLNANEWKKVQRPYIYHLYEEIQFGRYPSKKMALRFRVLEMDATTFDGLATRKQIRIYLKATDSSQYVDVLLYFPNSKKQRIPVFLGLNFFGNQAVQYDNHILLSQKWISTKVKGSINNRATDSTRGIESSQWPIKEILSNGYAVATAYCGDLEPDFPEGWKTGIRTSLQTDLQIKPEEWTAMGAWAYGLSSIVDYLETDEAIDPKKIALIGHSRLGKAALWAAASDPRFALVISNESGEGGAALSKRWYGETVKIITEKFPHWFMPRYKAYGDNIEALPIDGHMLLSLIAPRPLYVASAEGDTWSDPKGEFLSALEASKVYALFDVKGIDETEIPGLQHPVGKTVRYHIRAGKHDVTIYDWQQYLQFADDYLK